MIDMQVKLDDPNGKPERGVSLLVAGKPPYYETLRLASGWQRTQFVKRAAKRFGLETKDLQGLDDVLVEAAIESAAGDKKAIEYPVYTCANLMGTEFSTRFLVERILVEGQPAIVAGPQKSLKTSLLIDMALSLSQAGFWLGKFRVPEAVTVGVLTGESGMATIQETVKRISTAAGYDPTNIQNFVVSDRVPRFGNGLHEAALKKFFLEYEIRVCMVDPLYMTLDPDNMANLSAQGETLRRVNEICGEFGVSLILAHHTKKETSRRYEPLDLSDMSGAGVAEWSRQWILLSRREPYEPGTGLHKLWMSAGGSAGHGGCWGVDLSEGTLDDDGGRHWHVELFNRDEIRVAESDRDEERRQEATAAKVEKTKVAIVGIMAKRRFRDGETLSAIRDASPVRTADFKLAFGELLETGEVEGCEVQKSNRKRPYDGYRLADSDPL